jgi:hypothetical protein
MDEILSTVTIIDGIAGLVGPVCDNILPFWTRSKLSGD